MKTTKADLEVTIKMLRWNNEKLHEQIQTLQRNNFHLKEQLKSATSLIRGFSELPQAVHGATEALAHMLADARQLYMGGRKIG